MMYLPADDTGGCPAACFLRQPRQHHEESLVVRLAGYSATWNMTGATLASDVFLESDNHASIILGKGTPASWLNQATRRVLRTSGDAGSFTSRTTGPNVALV